jgi:hypothetical protein
VARQQLFSIETIDTMDPCGEKKVTLGLNGKEEEEEEAQTTLPLVVATPVDKALEGTLVEGSKEYLKLEKLVAKSVIESKLDGMSIEEPSKLKQLAKCVDVWYDGVLQKQGYLKKFMRFVASGTGMTHHRVLVLLAHDGVTEEYCKEVVNKKYPTETKKVFDLVRSKDARISLLEEQLSAATEKKGMGGAAGRLEEQGTGQRSKLGVAGRGRRVSEAEDFDPKKEDGAGFTSVREDVEKMLRDVPAAERPAAAVNMLQCVLGVDAAAEAVVAPVLKSIDATLGNVPLWNRREVAETTLRQLVRAPLLLDLF